MTIGEKRRLLREYEEQEEENRIQEIGFRFMFQRHGFR
jgi:hypothetical protein